MTPKAVIRLEPLGERIEAERGTPLRKVLGRFGVEFPCGGRGACRGCRIRVLEGAWTAGPEERQLLSIADLADRWRLACRGRVEGDLLLEVGRWDAAILWDHPPAWWGPAEGLGVAVDVGTTTLAAQILDLRSGRVLAVETAINPQAAQGADLISRLAAALDIARRERMKRMIQEEVGRMVRRLRATARIRGEPLREVVLVGNTAMHHLFCGIDVEPLTQVPFETRELSLRTFQAGELGWRLEGDPPVRFLPCLGGFVGSDVLAGLLALRMQESDDLVGLLDLGTNGEVAVGSRERILCASTAAGPAFEGARISRGMRAATGAVSRVRVAGGKLSVEVIGNVPPRGICGSGLVDAVAALLDLGRIEPSGRLAGGAQECEIAPGLAITQKDVRQLQLAKGAVRAATGILLGRLGRAEADLSRLHLAGAFGNDVDVRSARRIGLIGVDASRAVPSGNTALLGAKAALFGAIRPDEALRDAGCRIEHVELSADPRFLDLFAASMAFPAPGGAP